MHPDPALYQADIPSDNADYYEGAVVYVKAHLSLDGYTFTGWRYDNVNYPENGSFHMPDHDVTLVGRFFKNTVEQFAVRYVSGLQEGDPGCTAYHLLTPTFMENRNGTHTVKGFDDEDIHFEREGYEFIGWKLVRGSSGSGSGSGTGSRTQVLPRSGDGNGESGLLNRGNPIDNITSDITLTAQWREIPSEYTLTYDPNFGGDGSGSVPSPRAYSAGTQVEVAGKGDLTCPGKAFVCWNTKSDRSGTDYQPGIRITMNSDVTLYAIWTPVSTGKVYHLYYDANGATEGTPPQDTREFSGGETVLTAGHGNLARTGATFKQWNTRPDGSGDGYQDGVDSLTMPASDVTLYAIWETEGGKVLTPPTGESALPMMLAVNAALLALLAAGAVLNTARRKSGEAA